MIALALVLLSISIAKILKILIFLRIRILQNLTTLGIQNLQLHFLKDLIHVCLEPEAQGQGTTLRDIFRGSDTTKSLHKMQIYS